MSKAILVLLIIIAIGITGIGIVLGYNTWVSQPKGIPQPVTEVAPSAPSSLTAKALSTSQVELHWFDNSDNEKGFNVYRDNEIIATLPANTTTYQDTGLMVATTYQYRVTAYNQVGESRTRLCSVKTLNPPITVTLDKIGVISDHDPWLGAGDIYLYIGVADGKGEPQTYRIPSTSVIKLKDNETKEIGQQIFFSDIVGDELKIVAIAFESDAIHGLVLGVIKAALSSYLGGSGGAAVGLITTLLKSQPLSEEGVPEGVTAESPDDDFVGAIEKKWTSAEYWGIGSYKDVQSGDLRLWFTIESPLQPSTLSPPPTPTPTPAPTHFLITDSFTLAPFDEASLERKYPKLPSRYPFNEYGFYLSELFSLHESETANIIVRANIRICVENYMRDCGSELHVLIFRRIDSRTIRSNAAEIIACEVDNIAPGPCEARVTFNALESGSYQLLLVNESGKSTWCEYAVSPRE